MAGSIRKPSLSFADHLTNGLSRLQARQVISFRIRRSTGTADREAAEEYHDRLKAELWRVRRFGERSRHSWQEAAVKWLQETLHKATHDKDREILRWLDPYLSGKTLDKIDRELLLKIGEVKVKETSPATTNRYLALVRAILRKARDEWDWLERVPKIRFYVVRNKRIRWLRVGAEHSSARAGRVPSPDRRIARMCNTPTSHRPNQYGNNAEVGVALGGF